jgi:DNA-binding transcriptional LysR family regulator
MADARTSSERELARLAGADLNLLVPLLAVLEEQSVTRAAARVGLSQPAMSHALRRLRLVMNDQLLVRQGGAMVLTPRAEELLAPVRRALHESSRILSPPVFDPMADERTIAIALTTSTAFVLGPRLRRALAERAPNSTLRLVTTNLDSPTVFTDAGVDVILMPEMFSSPYPRERLYDDRVIVLASPDVRPDASALELITEEPHVVFTGVPTGRPRSYEVLDEHQVPYSVSATVSDYLVIPHLLATSRGVAMHRYQVGVEFRASHGLRLAEFPFPIQGQAIHVVWNPWLVDDQYRRWLRSVLIEASEPLRARATDLL